MEIVAYIISLALICCLVVFILVRMLKTVARTQHLHLRSEASKQLTPVRLRAYERMALFIDRIDPNSLLMRQNLGNNVSAAALHKELLAQIRQEWEHNAAQQIYVSNEAWTMVVNAKESIVELINSSAAEVQPNTVAMGLATIILNSYNNTKQKEETVLDKAIASLKKDIAAFC
ncbi:MAG: hypothetical protein ILP23_05585 [Paludibacteraceae bacterium]|nr:hypothetical protein [Paludibacteraceae bacterium]